MSSYASMLLWRALAECQVCHFVQNVKAAIMEAMIFQPPRQTGTRSLGGLSKLLDLHKHSNCAPFEASTGELKRCLLEKVKVGGRK